MEDKHKLGGEAAGEAHRRQEPRRNGSTHCFTHGCACEALCVFEEGEDRELGVTGNLLAMGRRKKKALTCFMYWSGFER